MRLVLRGSCAHASRLGSWDGEIRLWKLDDKLKSFALVGTIPALGVVNSLQFVLCPREADASIEWAHTPTEDGPSENNEVPVANTNTKPTKTKGGKEAQTALLVAGVGQEPRFGRWVLKKGEGYVNGALVVALRPRAKTTGTAAAA